jgi:hypothetical protein
VESSFEQLSKYRNRGKGFCIDTTIHPRTNLKLLQTFKFINHIKEREWHQNNILIGDDFLEDLQSTIDRIIHLTEKEID